MTRTQLMPHVMEGCTPEIETLCKDVPFGNGQKWKCLVFEAVSAKRVSASCMRAMGIHATRVAESGTLSPDVATGCKEELGAKGACSLKTEVSTRRPCARRLRLRALAWVGVRSHPPTIPQPERADGQHRGLPYPSPPLSFPFLSFPPLECMHTHARKTDAAARKQRQCL